MVGGVWFYWISMSFKYYGFENLAPLIVLGIALVFSLLFLVIGALKVPFIKAIALLGVSYIHPFGFDWFKPELIFVNSYFGVEKWQFAIILATIALYIHLKKRSFFIMLPLLLAFYIPKEIQEPELKIKLAHTQLTQGYKWSKANIPKTIESNFKKIDNAIKDGYDLIVLPESAFPLFLVHGDEVSNELLEKSKKIDIVTGALQVKNGELYNSSFHFDGKKIDIADKVVLVPFGERNPLPKFISDIINDLFFDGAKDYDGAKEPTDFEIKGIKFRNAICYEATSEKIYDKGVKYIVAISNNAWFYPSIEPTLQKILMKYYAKKYGVTIFHSANFSESFIVTP